MPGLNDVLTEGFKLASTGQDGKLYFVPWTYYCWGIHYRPSVFEANGWTPPATLDELTSLARQHAAAGIIPFALGNDGRWPAMGTFDQLNFRLNGYQFHVDLMAGRESWTDERVKNVFTQWESFLPYHQENPNGRTWEEAAAALVSKEAGMMTIGNFVGEVFPDGDDLGPRLLPLAGTESGVRHRHDRGPDRRLDDGRRSRRTPKPPRNSSITWARLWRRRPSCRSNPNVIAAATDADQSVYSALQQKSLEAVAAALA